MAFDPTILFTAEDEDLAPRRRGGLDVDLAPYKDMIHASYQSGKGKAVRIPAYQVKDVVRLIRAASKETFTEGVGVRLQFSWEGQSPTGTYGKGPDDENEMVKVTFAGRKARQTIIN